MHEFVYMTCTPLGKYFPYFKLKIHHFYILNLLNWSFLAFLKSENGVICTVTLRHLSPFWRVMVRYKVRKDFCLKGIFTLGKIPLLLPAKNTKNSIRNDISCCIFLYL